MREAPSGRLARERRYRPAMWVAALATTMVACGTAEAPQPDTDTATPPGATLPDATSPGATWPGETWPVSTPEAEGFDGQAIDALVADLEGGAYGLVDAFLLIRNGRAVADHRFTHDYDSIFAVHGGEPGMYNYNDPDWHPYYRDTGLHSLQSVTKSVTSAALGIAVDEGFIPGVDSPAYAWFGSYEPYTTDARKDATTLEDFLTMRSGIDWLTEGGYDNAVHSTVELEASDAWIRYVLERPTDTVPGRVFEYNDGVSVLLGKIVREATGQRVDDWARERLFEPIGIDEFHWKITPDGEADTEGGLYLATHDLARIGYLFLRGGEWDGRQVVSREWVEASTAPVVSDVNPDPDQEIGYGYQWWITAQEAGETRIFAGNGYGGQYVMVSPEHDIVVVLNGWDIRSEADLSTWRALQDRIIPALVGDLD
ncbi:MAG: serine hydrolase [Gemmatimonadetes bacterium]|nr:serine hydrolase [Gemmatimonadota bacterium]